MLLVEVELAHQHRVADRPDPEPGAAGAEREVDVVVEDEVRRVRQPDRVHDVAADHEPLEGDVLELDPLRHGRTSAVDGLDHAGLGLDRERVAQVEPGRGLLHEVARGVLADRHQAGLVLRHQRGQAVGGRDHVVVHQPDPVEAGVVRLPHAEVEAARAAEVVGRGRHPQRQVVAVEHLAGVVGAGVVDDEDRVGAVGLPGQAVEHPGQQVGTVEGHDDDGHGSSLVELVESIRRGTSRAP